MFYEAMSRGLDAGLSLSRAVAASGGLIPPGIGKMLEETAAGGHGLERVWEQEPDFFPESDRRLLLVAGTTGEWQKIFNLLAQFHRTRTEVLSKLGMGLAYPVFLLHFAVLIPDLSVVFVDGWFSYLFRVVPKLIIVWALLGASVYPFFSSRGRETMAGIPFVGHLFVMQDMSSYLYLFGLQLEAGIPMLATTDNARSVLLLDSLRDAADRFSSSLKAGSPFAAALKGSRLLRDQNAVEYLSSAEVCGKLPEAAMREAETQRQRFLGRLTNICKVVPLVLYLVIAAFIALKVINFFTGMYSL